MKMNRYSFYMNIAMNIALTLPYLQSELFPGSILMELFTLYILAY